jgi:CubicO group peptidase (beta-lactamase class C family)
MHTTYRVLSLMLLTASLASSVNAADEALAQKLQDAVSAVQQRLDIQGVSAAVLWNGQRYTPCAGFSFTGRAVTDDMILAIGSNTKTMTAVLLLRLQEDGLLDLDDAVSKHLPPHPRINPSITVRQLLNHTSGLGEYAGGQAYRDSVLANPRRTWQRDELFALIPPAAAAPGTAWAYCNTNYLVAGAIAEIVSGTPLHQLLARYISTPLQLDSMRLFPQDSLVGELAHRWLGGRDASATPMMAEWSGAWAAGAVISTARQYAAFYHQLFSEGVLSASSMSEFIAFVAPNSYGLGIRRLMVGGQIVYGHGGDIRGYTSSALWIPSLRASVVVLTNEGPGTPAAIADTIVRVLASHTTSVQESAETESAFTYPARVYDITGAFITTVISEEALRELTPGMFTLIYLDSRRRCVCVLPNSTLGFTLNR